MILNRILFAAFAVASAIGLPAILRGEADDINLGPLYTRDTTITGEKRVRILGPLFEQRTAPDGRVVKSLRPVFTRSVEADGKDSRTDLFWPLATAVTRGDEVTSRFATMYYSNFDKSNPMARWRLWVLPFLFMGRDTAGQGYFGVFPLGGRICEVLMFEKAEFLLFPLYAHTIRGREETTDILWPLISQTKGYGVKRARFFPFYGRTVRPGISESMFLLWPILTWARYVKPGQEGGGFVLFPFIGRIYRKDSKAWLLFPPLIRWTEGERLREINAPWPIFQYSKGRANRFYIWPLAGVKQEPGMKDGFLFWPFISSSHHEKGGETVDRLSVLPFLQYAKTTKTIGPTNAPVTETLKKSLKLWPLLSSRTLGATNTVKIPALWPSLDVAPIENTYEPVWTLFSRTDTADSSDSELLWGVIRRRTGPVEASSTIFPLVSWKRTKGEVETQDWSFLLGLIGYRKEGDAGSLRLFFMDFGGRKRGK